MPGWLDSLFGTPEPLSISETFDREHSRVAARQAEAANPYYGPLEGAGASMVSSIGELFGMDAPVSVETWRQQHPVLDVASSLAGMLVPYVGVELATTRIPSAARALTSVTEGTLKAFGTTSARSPILGGALKELYRYTPLELSRLGTGWALDADMGDMFSDVALSQAIAGSLGGVGGFLRAGGRAAERAAKLADAPEGLLPNFELRLAKDPESTILGSNVDREQFVYDKMQEALRYVPESSPQGLKGRYVYDLEGATPETGGFLESLYKPNPSRADAETLAARDFDIRQLHSDGRSWSVGEGFGDEVAKQAGLADLSELADVMAYPRHVRVQQPRAAGTMGGRFKQMLDSGTLQQIDANTWMAQEEGGLWHVVKRIERGAEPPKPATGRRAPYQFGPAQIRQGDRFLIGKTDKPDLFAKDLAKLNKATMDEWSKFKDPLRQLATDNPIGQQFNMIMRVLSPEDWVSMRTMRRTGWVSQFGAKLAAQVKAEAGLADQESIRRMAEWLYDIGAPKLFKMGSNTTFGRLYSLLEGGMTYMDSVTRKVMEGELKTTGSMISAIRGSGDNWQPFEGFRPVRELLASLTPDELRQVQIAAKTQTPAEDLQKVFDNISPQAVKAVKELQAINENYLQKWVIPALEEAGMAGEMQWLKGYITPRVYKGDFMVRVTDAKGKPQWLASGVTAKEAQLEADAIVAQAAEEGKVWKAQPYEVKAFKGAGEADNLDEVYNMVHQQMGQNADAQETVQRAYRKLLAQQSGTPTPGRPGTFKKRTGLEGSPDLGNDTLDDIIQATESHYRQLGRYAAYHSWRHRFGTFAHKWGQKDTVAYEDVMRKAGQWLGVEGQITQVINQKLSKVPGLGNKAGTKIALQTNKLMMAWNLGIANPSYALLNLLQPLQTTLPWISFMINAPREELARMTQMSLRFNSKGQVSGFNQVLAPIKVLGEAVGLMRNPTPELRQFFEQAVQDGTLAPQINDEWVGNAARSIHTLREAAGRGGWEFIKETATLLATRSEQFSRAASFNAAYLVGKDFMQLEGDALYRFVRKSTESTMYGYKVMDRSLVLTGPLGSTWGLFKNWQFHFIGDMMRYAGLAFKDGIWGPMLWQGGAAMAIGGLGATPLVMLADGLAKWNSDSPDSFTWLQDHWGKDTGDALYFGLPSLLGVSLQASSTLPGTDVMQDITTMGNIVAWERAKAAYGAIGAAADRFSVTGDNPLKDPNIRDQMLQAFAPRAVFRAFSSVEGDYVKSMKTGMPTVRDLPPAAKLLHGIGFNAVDVEKYYITGERLFKKQQRERELIQGLGAEMAQAQLDGDAERMTLIVQRAMASGVDVSSVGKSAMTRMRRETEGDYLSRFSKADQAEARKYLQD